MKKMIFIKKTGDIVNDPRYKQEVVIYKNLFCAAQDFWLVEGYEVHENGNRQYYHINNFREPHYRSVMTQELAHKQLYEDDKLRRIQEEEQKVFRTNADF